MPTGKPLVAFLGFAQTGVVDVTDTPAVLDGTLQVYVKQWTGSAWDFVGSDLTGGGASNAVSFAVDPTSFVHYADTPSIVVDSTGAPVVAFTYTTLIDDEPFGNADVYAVRWNGAAWVALGPAVPAGDSPAGQGGAGWNQQQRRRVVQPVAGRRHRAGRLALAWEDESATGDIYVWVRVWNGVDAWNELAGSASGSGFTGTGTANVLPQIAVDTSGRALGPSSPGRAGSISRRRRRSSCCAGTAPTRGRKWGSTRRAVTASARRRSRPSRRRWR